MQQDLPWGQYAVTAKVLPIILVLLFSSLCAARQTINLQPLYAAPVLDGQADDWSPIAAEQVDLRYSMPSDVPMAESVSVKAGWFENSVYFLFQWQDDTEDVRHKPAIWNPGLGKYEIGPQREDRFSVQFAMEGEYSTDWASGKSFTADMWHWKAKRSNTLGLAHDKKTIVSTEKLLRSYKMKAENGNTIYFLRPSDAGDRLYSTKRYRHKRRAIEPTYLLTSNPTGSVADVKARGVWADGQWTLELKRALNTGHTDDVIFEVGKRYQGGIAVFNHTEGAEHAITDTIWFELLP